MEKGSQPIYKIKAEKNIYVTMRDGVRLALDVYRPDAEGKFPALLAMSAYGKDMQTLPVATQRKAAGALLWDGVIEAGDTKYIVPRGYVHVIGDVRGSGDSEGEHVGFVDPNEARDTYEVIEWMAQQPWCDGNVGMLGISYYAMLQVRAAIEQPPHLKAIFPFEVHVDMDSVGVIGQGSWRIYSGRPMDPGINNGSGMAPRNYVSALMRNLPKEDFEKLQQEKLQNPDLIQYSYFWSVARYPFKCPIFADQLLDPEGKYLKPKAMKLDEIKVPVFTGGPWTSGWPDGAFDLFQSVNVPKKILMVPPGTVDRPWNTQHEELIRWMDHWLKGIDTGMMEEPPIKIFITGAHKWRYEHEWPLAVTKWTKFYLRTWNQLLEDEPGTDDNLPDCFVQEPLSKTTEVQSIKYTTPPLPQDMTVIGPLAFHFYAAIDQDDTNWNIKMMELDENGRPVLVLPPQFTHLADSWLKASFRTLDNTKSKPWRPWHLGKKEPV
ncbi:MAG: hypothetical protein A2144_04295, partial [Chloroflexi bacterium RBG_16_50_9]